MKKWIVSLLVLPCAVFAANIEGTYNVTGFDPYENQSYSGTATIKLDKNDVYQMAWTLQNGVTAQGTALLQGSELSAVFIENKQNRYGVQIYTISSSGTLEGGWVFLNQNLVGREKLSKP